MATKVKTTRSELLDAVIDGNVDRLRLLLAQGVDPNAADTAGWTALHFAAQRQDADQIQALLSAGAAVDAVDQYGNTPLWRAVFAYWGSPSAITALKVGGADLDIPNSSGVSPRSLASTIANYDVKAVL